MSQVEGDDGRVLENFIDVAGRLLSIPVQRKKRLAVLRWMAEDFQPGRLYPEEEVNRIISRRHPDFAALRRYLVDEELMQRRRGVYWRTGSVANVGYDPPSWPGAADRGSSALSNIATAIPILKPISRSGWRRQGQIPTRRAERLLTSRSNS